jgi:hypothetical protein
MLPDEDSLVVAAPGALYGVQVSSDGALRQTWENALPAGVDPSALGGRVESHGEESLEVLDRAGDQVLLFRGTEARGFRPVGGLPAGHEPADLIFADLNSDANGDMVIADAGGDALTIWMGRKGGTWGPMRTVPVGHRPVAVVPGSFDDRHTTDLAIANSGSNDVTILYGDDKGQIRDREQLPVGRDPVALAGYGSRVFPDEDLNGDSIGDLVVADSASDDVRVFYGSEDGPLLHSAVHLPPGSRPAAIAPGVFTHAGNADLAVALAGTGAVSFLMGDGHGRFSPQPPVTIGGQPIALTSDDYAGDELSDVIAADATGALVTIPTGDRLLVGTHRAAQAMGADGVIYWSESIRGRERARSWDGTTATMLAIPPSTRSMALYPGIDSRGRREVTYVRCLHRRCAPHAFRLPNGPETAVALDAPAGCEIDQFARWRQVSAYDVRAVGRHCPAADRGLWITAPGRPPRRVAERYVNLAGVHGTTVGWADGHRVKDGPTVVRMRAASADGPPRTLDWDYSGGVGCDLGFTFGGVFDGGYLYWSGECESDVGGSFVSFKRARLGALGCHSSLGAVVSFPPFDFAVSDGDIFYLGDRGLLQVDPARARWPRERCRR